MRVNRPQCVTRRAGSGTSPGQGAEAREVEDLELQVRNLERPIGQRTLEIELLKELLEKGSRR